MKVSFSTKPCSLVSSSLTIKELEDSGEKGNYSLHGDNLLTARFLFDTGSDCSFGDYLDLVSSQKSRTRIYHPMKASSLSLVSSMSDSRQSENDMINSNLSMMYQTMACSSDRSVRLSVRLEVSKKHPGPLTNSPRLSKRKDQNTRRRRKNSFELFLRLPRAPAVLEEDRRRRETTRLSRRLSRG